jgi:serine/threonine protein kinase
LDGDASALGSDPYIGRQLGDRFFLQSFLGSGEIGLVYRGTDVSTSQDVAVKIIHPDVAATIGDRLLRSAVAISQVRHAKLASVLAAARVEDLGRGAFAQLAEQRVPQPKQLTRNVDAVDRAGDGGLPLHG